MSQSFKAIAILATITFVIIALAAAQFGLLGIKAMQENYINMSINNNAMDIDRDGIPDAIDDSDGDSIPDKYDATPYGHDIDIFEIRTRGVFNQRHKLEPKN